MTRAMLVTVLYRAEGEPAITRNIPFADIDMNEYYANAVIWAAANGIVNGYDENTFAPNDNITREQIAAIMERYADFKAQIPRRRAIFRSLPMKPTSQTGQEIMFHGQSALDLSPAKEMVSLIR